LEKVEQSAAPVAPDDELVPVGDALVAPVEDAPAEDDGEADLLLQPAMASATQETAAAASAGRRWVVNIIDIPP
jgi:hypothetical protein